MVPRKQLRDACRLTSATILRLLVVVVVHLAHAQLQQPPFAMGPPGPPPMGRFSFGGGSQAGGPPPPPPFNVQPGGIVIIPGNEQLLRQASRVDQIILPYENFLVNRTSSQVDEDFRVSNIIDHKRFVEPFSSRCFSSTLLSDPDSVEPNFVVIRSGSEVRVNATAPLQTIQASGYNPKLRTTILVHGFTQSYPNSDWLRKARAIFEQNQLVAHENLIIMDWGTASSGSYAQVAAMTSGMGSFLANFLMKLLDLGADRRSIHLVGHSLGAHVCGFAGKRIRPHLGRITALDPAGPCFGKFFSNSPNDRLSLDDATEVDVFHYDDGFLGLGSQIGHFDVFVNGGSSQPGAVDNVNAMFQAIITMLFRRKRVLSESHTRSTEVATSQLNPSGCQQMAYECRDYPAFLSGECGFCDNNNEQCFLMSLPFQYANMEPQELRRPAPGKRLFISTAPTELYCLHHFQLLVRFELTPDLAHQAKRNKWRIELELENERRERSNVSVSHQLEPTTFSGLLLLPGHLTPTKFRRAALQVRSGLDNTPVQLNQVKKQQKSRATGNRPFSQPFRVSNLEINFMSHVDFRARQALSSRLCPTGWLTKRAPASENNSINNLETRQDDEWLSLEECR